MKQLTSKLQFKKDGIYLAYLNEEFADETPNRKTISIFRYVRGKMYGKPLWGVVMCGWYSHANGHYIDWGVMQYTMSSNKLYLWPEDEEGTVLDWKKTEFFELTEDEILKHVVAETI